MQIRCPKCNKRRFDEVESGSGVTVRIMCGCQRLLDVHWQDKSVCIVVNGPELLARQLGSRLNYENYDSIPISNLARRVRTRGTLQASTGCFFAACCGRMALRFCGGCGVCADGFIQPGELAPGLDSRNANDFARRRLERACWNQRATGRKSS